MTPTWERPGTHPRLSPIYLLPESAEILLQICKEQKFRLYEDAVLWLIENWVKSGFDWKFNKCNHSKFWFGDRVKFHDRLGTVYGMEWREKEMSLPNNGKLGHGWWYRIRWDGRDSLQGVHESNLIPVKN